MTPQQVDWRRAAGIGVVTGVFSGLTGVGGGAILVSLLVSMLGLSQHLAQGTTPAIILPVALFGAITYAVQGVSGQFVFDVPLALSVIPALAFPSMFGVIIGSTWMSALPAAQLRRAFGVFLFFVALSMLTRDILPIGAPAGQAVAVPFIFWILLGFVAGVFAGFLGIGGALVMVPFMTLGAGMPQHMSQGVTLAVVTITTAVGAYTQRRLGNVSGPAARGVTVPAVVTVVAAALLAGRLDGFWLTKIFGVTMVYFGYQFTFVTPKPRGQAPGKPLDPAAGFYHI
jgi:hypothetical protein